MTDPAMTNRGKARLGMVAGLVWSVGLLWLAATYVTLPIFALVPTIMTAFLAPGVVMLLMIARLAQRRHANETSVDGTSAPPGQGADIDQRVLTNTVEQVVLALCIWPAAAVLLAEKGPGVIVTLGIGFALARVAFWIGYHRSPPLRAFGFAASFFPTILVTLWTAWRLIA